MLDILAIGENLQEKVDVDIKKRKFSKDSQTLEIELIDKTRKKMMESYKYVIWFFVSIATVLALAEPIIICSRNHLSESTWIKLQGAVLAVSTFLYMFSLFVTYCFVDKERHSNWKRFHCLFDGEVKFETGCLIIGWACLFTNPGIAALRCMRVFRMLWFFELVDHTKLDNPGDHPLDLAKCFHICVQVIIYILIHLF